MHHKPKPPKEELAYTLDVEVCSVSGCKKKIMYAGASFDEETVSYFCQSHAQERFDFPFIKWFHIQAWHDRDGLGFKRNAPPPTPR